MDHDISDGGLRRFPGGQWAADCTCGRWFGPPRVTRHDAAQEWVVHATAAYARATDRVVAAAAVKACAA